MDSDESPSTPESGIERRRSERVPSDRNIRFSDYQALGPLRDGQLLDISSTGFKVRTDFPEELGALLQIEMLPKTDEPTANVVLFEGRVMHVVELPSGGYAMGVRRIQKNLHAQDLGSTRTSASNNDNATRDVTSALDNNREVRFRNVQSKKSKNDSSKKLRVWFMLLAGSLFLLMLGGTIAASHTYSGKLKMGTATPSVEPIAEEGQEDLLVSYSSSTQVGEQARAVEPLEVALASIPADRKLNRAFDFSSPLPIEEESPHLNQPVDEFRRFLTEAYNLEQKGQFLAARGWAHRAVAIRDSIPEPWKTFARGYIRHLITDPGAREFQWMNQWVPLKRTFETNPSKSGLQLHVDTSSFLLTLKKNGKVIYEYPVGLGQFNTTPKGTFEIANKLTNPDWFNNGTVVPYGDPKNPIGDYWMGLGVNAVPTSYGIHPTKEAASIGQSQSQGCIRMRPEDAKSLFRLVPVGTPVTIF
jgi:lipoprotein-anchoring transpeptidase ErfK/SrfK